MGVPGLWDLLRPAATRASLSTLARDAFLVNKGGLRALTIGIDASIWIFHAQVPVYGENPFLRTIFYKITTLLQQPVLPVFVFDGPNKPSRKRNQHVAGQFGHADHRSKQFKELLDVCGLEWWNAPGEAEAELAVMNRQGKIDAVLSDDVDALLFGATCLLRNNSPTLSGAQASQSGSGRDSRLYEVFRSDAIRKVWTEKEGTSLTTEEDCRMAMVLIALMSGGDYAPEGLDSIGPTISYGLAHAGLADFLKRYSSGSPSFRSELAEVQRRMVEELRTNESKHLGRRYPDRSSKLAARDTDSLFTSFALISYLRPCTSPLSDPTQGWQGFGNGESSRNRGKARNEGRGDLEGMAKACEKYFEWGTREIVGKKFAGESVGLFGSEILNDARQLVRSKISALSSSISPTPAMPSLRNSVNDRITSFFPSVHPSSSMMSAKALHTSSIATPASIPPYILKIANRRDDPSNPELNEYRLLYRPDEFTSRCNAAMDGHRLDPKALTQAERSEIGLVDKGDEMDLPSSSQAVSKTEIRAWIPEYILEYAYPDLVRQYEEGIKTKEELKKAKAAKSSRTKKVQKKDNSGVEDTAAFRNFFSKSIPTSSQTEELSEEEEEPVESPPSSRSSTRRRVPLKKTASPSAMGTTEPVVRSPARRTSTSPGQCRTPRRSTSTVDLTASPSPPPPPSSRQTAKSGTSVASRTSPTPRSPSRSKKAAIKTAEPSTAKNKLRRSTRLSSGKASTRINDQTPIDLCSSDNETPKAKPRSRPKTRITASLSPAPTNQGKIASSPFMRPRTTQSRTSSTPLPVDTRESVVNTPVTKTKRTSSRTSKSPTTTTSASSSRKSNAQPNSSKSTQAKLDLQVIKANPSKATSKAKQPKLTYVVVSETEEEEVLDLTVRCNV